MTKKVFIEAAKLIKERFPDEYVTTSSGGITEREMDNSLRQEVANTFAILFARHNAAFNKTRFFEACGL